MEPWISDKCMQKPHLWINYESDHTCHREKKKTGMKVSWEVGPL